MTCFVDHLSDDDLHNVFQSISEDERRQSEPQFLRLAITLSHVSRRWRNIALDYPFLWAHITHNSPRWTTIQLQRSRSAALHVRWKKGYDDRAVSIEPLLHVLEDHLERLESLDLTLIASDFDRILKPLLRSGPKLRSLTLALSGYHGAHHFLYYPDESLPTFSPLLQQLRLQNFVFEWPESAAHWPNLTCLEIKHHPEIHAHRVELTLANLLATFLKMPNLQFVDLSHTALGLLRAATPLQFAHSPKETHEAWNCVPKIPLMALKTLRASFVDLHSAVDLSRHITVHPYCSIYYVIAHTSGRSGGMINPPHAVLLFQNIRPSGLARLSLDRLEIHSSFGLRIRGSGVAPDDFRFSLELSLPSRLYLSFPREFVSTACQFYDLTAVCSLEVRLYPWPRHSPSFWTDCFGRCTHVEDLTTQEEVLCGPLASNISEGDSDNVAPLLFPKLRRLYLPHGIHSRQKADLILATLVSRKRRGHGLQTLVISGDTVEGVDWASCAAECVIPEPSGLIQGVL